MINFINQYFLPLLMTIILDEKLATAITNTEEGTRGYIFLAPIKRKELTEIPLDIVPIIVSEDIYNNIQPTDAQVLDYAKNKEFRIMLFHNTYTEKNLVRMQQLFGLNPNFSDFIMKKNSLDYYKRILKNGLGFWEKAPYRKSSNIYVPQYLNKQITEIKLFHDTILPKN